MNGEDEIKFLRRPVDTMRLGLAAARDVGASTTKHPVQIMQEEVRHARASLTEAHTAVADDGCVKSLREIRANAIERVD